MRIAAALALLALAGCEENIIRSPERGAVAPWLRLDREARTATAYRIYAYCDTQNWNLLYVAEGNGVSVAVVKEGCKP